MGVVAFRELIGRNLAHRLGDSPTASRRFAVHLDDPSTPAVQIINAVGIFHGAPHPELSFLKMLNATVTEGTPNPFSVEINYDYELPTEDERDPNPLSRPDVWSFSTGGAAVPALTYFDGTTLRPLVNSAKDFFEGAMTEEAEVRASISGNRPTFPAGLAASVTNCINSDGYLGAAKHTWKCQGISAQQATEMVNDIEVRYWQITTELVFRQSGWNLQLPDVGYNCIEGGTKIRAYVFDPDDSTTRIACASPIALNDDGTIRTSGFPSILERRVHREIGFSGFFGTPPF